LLAALVLLSPLADAQPSPLAESSPAFNAVLQSPQHHAAVLGAVKQSTVWRKHACAAATFAVQKVMIYHAPSFDASGKPLSGVWGEKLRATGCGNTLILNAVTQVRSPGVLVSGALAPGDTVADPILQRDASLYARPVLMRGHAGCRDAYVENTEVLNKTVPQPGSATGPVRFEKWTAFVCGSTVAVELMFTPNATGTTIAAYASNE
jgi:hypothetical protein